VLGWLGKAASNAIECGGFRPTLAIRYSFLEQEIGRIIKTKPGAVQLLVTPSRAGEEIRTPDVQLGKLAFYH